MARPPKKLVRMKEPDGARGNVPSRLVEGSRDRTYSAYLDTLNPRGSEDLQQALAASPDVRFRSFLERVMSPSLLRVSYATMAKACGISLLEFQQWWSKASTARSIAIAQTASPRIVSDMVEDSCTREDVCDRCDGIGSVLAPEGLDSSVPGYRLIKKATSESEAIYTRTCPKCHGHGQVRKSGDSHARDRILEMAGLKDSPKAASVVLNFGGAAHSASVSMLDEAMSLDKPSTIDVHAEDLD